MELTAKRVDSYSDRLPSVACYWQEADAWFLLLPDEVTGAILANLASHTVEEHEDGTISVTPSIKVWDDRVTRHGYLTRGVWTEC